MQAACGPPCSSGAPSTCAACSPVTGFSQGSDFFSSSSLYSFSTAARLSRAGVLCTRRAALVAMHRSAAQAGPQPPPGPSSPRGWLSMSVRPASGESGEQGAG